MAQQTLPRHLAASARESAPARDDGSDNRVFLLMTVIGVVSVCGAALLLAIKF